MKKILFNVTAFIIAINATAQEATFESLGILPGGQNSMAHAVSANGNIVVGQSESSLGPLSGTEAFRWNESEGIVGLGDLPGGIFTSFARGVSSDGNIIVGTGWGDGFTEALRWENDVMESIGFLPGGSDSFAYAISDDGLTIVGYGFNSMWSSEAFRWTQENGIEGLGFLSGEAESTGFDVSGDGSVIVGYAMRSDGFYEAFRWTEAGGMEGLGDLPGGYFESTAWGVSADGSTIVGYSSTGPVDYEAFRWTEAGGMESIGDLPGGGTFGMARATSADGSVIVGEGLIEGGSVAFYWTENEGMRNLKEILENDHGLDLQGWTLSYASSVSDDGRTIVGYAVNPLGQTEAFRVVLPEVTSCQAPGSFFLDEVTESTASFSWNPSPSEVTGYNWFVMNFGDSPDENDPVANGTTLSWMTWTTASDLTPDTTYYVYLQANCNGGEQSDFAGPFMITTASGGGEECEAPGSFFLDEVTESTASFSWNPSPSEVTGYNWFVMNFGDSPDENDPVANGTTLSWMTWTTASDLTPDTTYYVYLQANCNGGEQSDYAGPFMITTAGGGGECVQPSDITVSTVTDSVVFVSWMENGNASAWEIEYGETGFIQGEGILIIDNDGSPNETINGLIQGVEYEVYVRAICDNGESEWTGPVNFVIAPEPCLSPSDIIVDTVTPSMVYVTWTENGDASAWEIEYGETGFTQGEGTTIIDNDGMPGEAIAGLQEGINYDVYVRAICEFSGSEWVGPVTFNTEEMGIQEFTKQMVLYPNPTTGIINIETNEKINSVSVYNSVGQKVAFNSLNQENTSIDISNLSNGIYFVEIILKNNTVKKYKVIKK